MKYESIPSERRKPLLWVAQIRFDHDHQGAEWRTFLLAYSDSFCVSTCEQLVYDHEFWGHEYPTVSERRSCLRILRAEKAYEMQLRQKEVRDAR